MAVLFFPGSSRPSGEKRNADKVEGFGDLFPVDLG